MQTLSLTAVFLITSATGFSQIDGAQFASDLRAKFGPPLAHEVFATPVGEMVVNYAANGHVCRIELPPIGPDAKRAGVQSAQAVDDFVLQLLPLSMRGKEIGKFAEQQGVVSLWTDQFENLTVGETSGAAGRTRVFVTFKGEMCQGDPTAH